MADYEAVYFLEDDDAVVPLQHFGFNIDSRAARMRIAGRRGENYLVPGRNGEVLNRSKPYEANFLPLEMWAQGAEADGDAPADPEAKLDYWMDYISQLFSFDGLKRFVSASTPDYGRVNLIPNPSMENAGQLVQVAENVINNPSGEFSEGQEVIRRNFADNPGMESSQADEAFRTNYIRNPRMTSESPVTIVRRNFAKNPSGEAGTKFWRAQSNAKIMTSRKTRVAGSWPIQGQQSIRAVATGTGPTNMLVEAHSIEVDPSTAYSFSGYMWQRTELNMTCRMFVRWYNKNGTFISATSNVDNTVAPDQVVRAQQANVTSPAGAATAVIRFVLVNALQDDVMYVDAIMATKTTTVLDYFDGDTDEQDGMRFRWKDTVGRSVSEQYYVSPRGWTSPIATVKATTDHSRVGIQSAKVQIGTATVANDILLRNTLLGGAPIEEETWISGSIAVRRQDLDDTAAARTVKLRLQCWDSDGNLLGTALDGPGGATLADVTLTLTPTVWQTVQIEGGYTLAETEKVSLAVLCGEAWSTDEVAYFDTAIVEASKKADEWFDGGIDDDDVFNYEWGLDGDGDPHWSASIAKGSNIKGWMAAEGRQYQSTDGYIREYSLALTPFRSPASTERPAVHSQVLDLRPGRKHMLSMYVKLSRSVSVKLGVTFDDTVTWTYNTATAPSVGVWTRLTFGFTVPAGSDPDLTRIGFFYNAAPADGDLVLIDSVLFEPSELARKYFDGESGERCAWLDDPERSVAVRYRDRANGWHGYGDSYPIARRQKATASQGSYVVRVVASQAGELGVTFAQDGIDTELTYAFGVDFRPGVTRNGYVAIVWLDEEGTQLGISQSSTTSVPSGSTTRKTITGTPTAGASVGVPIAVLVGAAADEIADFDGARFGFGTDTTFKDGDSASWRWTGERGFSESEDLEPGVDWWRSNNGTLVRNGTWSTNRSNNATYTVTGAGSNTVYAIDTGKDDERRFRISDKEPWLSFGIDLRSVSVDAQVEVGFLLSKWTKQGWTPASVASLKSAKTSLTSGVDARKTYTVDTSAVAIGDATHFRPAVWLYNSAGANAAVSQVLRLDSASVSRDDTTSYQDGTFQYVVWMGDADASKSRRVGPARRIQVERLAGIEPVVSHNGTLARFAVLFNCPKTFWEDTISITQRLAIPRKGGVLMFDKFNGCTAPIEDAVWTLNGPFKDIKLTDQASGEWVRINERFGPDQNIIVDSDKWDVRRGNGKKLWPHTTFSDNGVLLPMTPPNDHPAPRLVVDADSIGRGAYISVTARRRFHIG